MQSQGSLTAADLRQFVAAADASPEFQCASAERRWVIERSMGELSLRHLRLIDLRYRRGLTFLEIAGDFGVVESAVHAMHGRILRALREALLRQGIRRLSDIL